MAFQNRVDPYGRLRAIAVRGAWMGNRGVLIDADRHVVAPWRLKRWITCVLRFKDRHREVFTPGRYTELFFLDEATSLAAGHRPCAECRRGRYEEYRAAWAGGSALPSADEMDRVLHAERLDTDGGKKTYVARISELPDGVMVERGAAPHLWWRGGLRAWSFAGYGPPFRVPAGGSVTVLTPRSTVQVVAAGFAPQVHETASAG